MHAHKRVLSRYLKITYYYLFSGMCAYFGHLLDTLYFVYGVIKQ